MKFTITRSNFLAALNRCVPLTKQKSPMPILQCALLRADMMGLTASATNLQQSVTTKAPYDAHTSGAVAVHTKDLVDRVKSFPEGMLSVTLDGDKLLVACGKRKHKLPTMPAEDYPLLAPNPEGGITLPADKFRGLLERARPAACDDVSRPNINSVLLGFKPGMLTVDATDGCRLHMAHAEAPVTSDLPSVILPLASVDVLLAILDGAGDVTIGMSLEEFGLRAGDTTFTTKLISGEFPDLRSRVAKPGPVTFRVEAEAFVDCLTSTALSTPDGDLYGKLTMTVAGSELGFEGEGKGAASDTLELAAPAAGSLKVSFQSRYVADAVQKGKPVDIGAGPTDLDPIYLTSEGLVALVMPCRF